MTSPTTTAPPRPIGAAACEQASATSPSTAAAPRAIGADLERLRLEDRSRRIGFALAALRRLSDTRAPGGPAPVPLRQAIAGFSEELRAVDRRLAEL